MFLNDGLLTSGLAQGIPTLWSYANIASQVVLPIGYTILALFFLLELLRCSSKVESTGGGTGMGAQMIAAVLIKLALCKLLIDNTSTLMTAIFDGMSYLTTQVSQALSGQTTPTMPALQLTMLDLDTMSLGFMSGLGFLAPAIVVLLLVAATWIVSRLMIYLRFIQAYLYLIIAPIPLATLPEDEWSQIGKSFVKSFAAVAIHGTILFLTMAFFPVIVEGIAQQLTAAGSIGGGEIMGALLQEAFFALLLLFSLSGTTRIANSICNAM